MQVVIQPVNAGRCRTPALHMYRESGPCKHYTTPATPMSYFEPTSSSSDSQEIKTYTLNKSGGIIMSDGNESNDVVSTVESDDMSSTYHLSDDGSDDTAASQHHDYLTLMRTLYHLVLTDKDMNQKDSSWRTIINQVLKTDTRFGRIPLEEAVKVIQNLTLPFQFYDTKDQQLMPAIVHLDELNKITRQNLDPIIQQTKKAIRKFSRQERRERPRRAPIDRRRPVVAPPALPVPPPDPEPHSALGRMFASAARKSPSLLFERDDQVILYIQEIHGLRNLDEFLCDVSSNSVPIMRYHNGPGTKPSYRILMAVSNVHLHRLGREEVPAAWVPSPPADPMKFDHDRVRHLLAPGIRNILVQAQHLLIVSCSELQGYNPETVFWAVIQHKLDQYPWLYTSLKEKVQLLLNIEHRNTSLSYTEPQRLADTIRLLSC